MGKYSPNFKQNILTQYAPNQHQNGFHSLATRYKIPGGASTIKRWYDRWNGSIESLNRKASSGRKPILNTQQIKQYIGNIVKKKNQNHQHINYYTIQQQIKQKTNKSISLRTVQRYGKEKLGIKKRRTKKYMNRECKCTYINRNDNYLFSHCNK